jgi:hypothetical protein
VQARHKQNVGADLYVCPFLLSKIQKYGGRTLAIAHKRFFSCFFSCSFVKSYKRTKKALFALGAPH